ncbi:cytochrome b561 [Sphingobium sp. AP50]|uniref:cytochrome b n=1 Tax=Sphingobium sp. AP50 TaxID=1884369 RepID=UPI0008CC93A8|nr:cytochrome b/b6 domain-containing protein [Sphingobium sp. AP50]SEK06243.1 cytochrome b561 [Sphingobium sp. AP50]
MLKSDKQYYGNVPTAIHWISAVIIFALLVTGFTADGAASSQMKIAILRTHIPFGLALLLLTAVRIIWWWCIDAKPEPVLGARPIMTRAAAVLHILLYATLLGMIASGLAMVVLKNAWGAIFLSYGQAALPDFDSAPPRGPHGAGALALMALLTLHVAAALFHQFVKRDRIFRRMWFRRNIGQ